MPRKRGTAAMTDTDQYAPDAPADDTPDTPATDTDAEKAAAKAAAEEADKKAIEAIQGFSVASPDLAAATTPVRNRKERQKAMDAVAVQAYADWTEAGRPTIWAKMPVITYFLEPEEVSDYRTLIRKACEMVTPTDYTGDDGETVSPSGVRARYGNPFPLTEALARKAGITEEWKIGKTVLSWAAVDKRKSGKGNGDS